ncbi:phosphate ABC transporter, permease protein PstA [Alkalilimnicola ehrlichii]|uniref:Phosphate transport system permease protein PstA n=1 Tax=Alkalilimnicola ehrlichii TaxID=351052 RepID=A0A3E0WY62_9GAMM|nr:phosphate ABC transporter permease PstA [Alkalilimnicola ehrlichii]RFA30378.1 phosphate ABC transporter, permease protein PstA [Alkalilimnicola ehrlichii]RFA37950.1 phosphate ABC transporter, permease protein PstA [Alkalilimnicola ehrlichii]
MKEWMRSGTPWVWLTGGAVAVSLVMVLGLLLMIGVRGLGHFWPSAVVEFDYAQEGQQPVRVLGELSRSETLTAAAMREAGHAVPEDQEIVVRHLIKRGNRDVTGSDFVWYLGSYSSEWRYPSDAMVLERLTWGDFIGYLREYREDGEVIVSGSEARQAFEARLQETQRMVREIAHIERVEIGAVNREMERLRLVERGLNLRDELGAAEREQRQAELAAERAELDAEYAALQARRNDLRSELRRYSIVAEVMDGRMQEIQLGEIVKAWWPNDMGFFAKLGFYGQSFWDFISGFPREANTEGGILPAIFGTVMMVMIMSVVVTPFGVMAAIYLREYAKQGPLTRAIRISVNNLAGVPSIVFGVFGLGFFVYFIGGGIDQVFYQEALPSPTYGGPAIIWASLTLALLTLPVVIVSTEEGLSRIPASIRQGSLALGATKAETLWRVVVPLSAPAMMTGLILAVARAAGEVAPLMLVGVVKLAPSLPVDGTAPYLHLDRAFMHLGFHIFDVGFQSPNVEAGRPLVYATALVLVLIIIILNLTAIAIRNRLREKYKAESD